MVWFCEYVWQWLLFWIIQTEKSRRIFENVRGEEMDYLWQMVHCRASPWASISLNFWDNISLLFFLIGMQLFISVFCTLLAFLYLRLLLVQVAVLLGFFSSLLQYLVHFFVIFLSLLMMKKNIQFEKLLVFSIA